MSAIRVSELVAESDSMYAIGRFTRTGCYTLLYDCSTTAKNVTSLTAGLLFLSSFVASSTLVASSDTIDNLNIISVICGRVASVAADLAKSSAAR